VFTVQAPADLPEGRYVIGSSLTYPELRGKPAIRGGTVEVWRPARWLVIGPFDHPEGKGLETVYPPEAAIDLAGEWAGKEGAVRWRPLADNKIREDGYVDFLGVFSDDTMAVAYAATALHAATDTAGQVWIGSDDGVAVWVNGERVLARDGQRSAAPDQDRAAVELRAGWNPVLIKVDQWDGDWGFYFRVTDGAGRPIPGVRLSPDGLREAVPPKAAR